MDGSDGAGSRKIGGIGAPTKNRWKEVVEVHMLWKA